MTTRVLCLFVLLSSLEGCGVRGKPMPPDTPPLLGRGEPSFTKATEKVTVPAKKKRKNSNDWNESDDFQGDN